MATISIGELMTVKLETIDSSSSAQEASKKMKENNTSSLVVIDNNNNNKPIGIVTERDLARPLMKNSGKKDSLMHFQILLPAIQS